jgi:hypothetical protein
MVFKLKLSFIGGLKISDRSSVLCLYYLHANLKILQDFPQNVNEVCIKLQKP